MMDESRPLIASTSKAHGADKAIYQDASLSGGT